MTQENPIQYKLDVYSINGNRRGILTVKLNTGEVLPVESPSELGEFSGTGNYEYQKQRALRAAIDNKAAFTEIDHDLIQRVRAEKERRRAE